MQIEGDDGESLPIWGKTVKFAEEHRAHSLASSLVLPDPLVANTPHENMYWLNPEDGSTERSVYPVSAFATPSRRMPKKRPPVAFVGRAPGSMPSVRKDRYIHMYMCGYKYICVCMRVNTNVFACLD